jgi:pyruvate dehydrogenase E2 component (dihydrolipoamide acetyltransferase)
MRQAIGQSMARSKREIPHYYLQHHADLTAAEAFLARHNADAPPDRRLLMGALFVKAVAKAARGNAKMNGHFEEGAFRPADRVHCGVAVALRGGGLTAPAIHDCDRLALDEVMAAMRDLVARARSGRLRASEMAGGTITVSSLGERGVEAMTAVIVPPQVAIVSFGTPVRRPWVVDDTVVPRTVVAVTLAADHRVSDARQGGRFLAAVTELLEDPEAL